MFGLVSESKFNYAVHELRLVQSELTALRLKHGRLTTKWNNLVAVINDNGGRAWLDNAVIPGKGAYKASQFTDSELRSILQLVHPDKHGAKQSAIVITQKINALRK